MFVLSKEFSQNN